MSYVFVVFLPGSLWISKCKTQEIKIIGETKDSVYVVRIKGVPPEYLNKPFVVPKTNLAIAFEFSGVILHEKIAMPTQEELERKLRS